METDPVHVAAFEKLQKMGFSSGDIHRASEECSSIDFDDLLDFLLSENEDVSSEESDFLEEPNDDGIRAKLKGMGFSSDEIQRTLAKCGCMDLERILEVLIGESGSSSQTIADQPQVYDPCDDEDANGDIKVKRQRMNFSSDDIQKDLARSESPNVEDLVEVQTGENAQTSQGISDSPVPYNDSFEVWNDDDDGVRSKLRGMGFSVDEIQNALVKHGNLDIEGLVEVLIGDESSSFQGTGNPLKIKQDLGSTRFQNRDQSRCYGGPSKQLNWSHHQLRRWYTYLGRRAFYFEQFAQHSREGDSPGFERFDDHMYALEKKRLKGKKVMTEVVTLPKKRMMGFGIPGLELGRPNRIPNMMQGPPYFYFENVAGAPKNEWDTIKRHFNGVDPEFTDAKYFCACTRPRGYVHNLPVTDREVILPIPPKTIAEAFPAAQKYWPVWDTREKINCINTKRGGDALCELIRDIFVQYGGESEIPEFRQHEILQAVKKWNLIWVGPGQTAPLELHEVEMLLGYDRDHTRGCLTMTDRYDLLGNSFQVDTVAYHLSPLKYLYPDGLTVLSMFSGIGGAEVALHRLGMFLKCVIAVEVSEKARKVLSAWWKKSGQKGELILKDDVRGLTDDVLVGLIDRVGRIDLVVGGSPCNNLSGNNRVDRVGLSGKESSLFFEFPRVLNIIKRLMSERSYT